MRTSKIYTFALGLFVFSVVTLFFMACAQKTRTPETPPLWTLKDLSLAQEVARFRSALISGVKYELEVSLAEDSKTFEGTQLVTFRLSDNSRDIPIEYRDGVVQTMNLNGKDIKIEQGPTFLRLPAANLVKGQNSLRIAYKGNYSTTGTGLHRFQDPVDKQVYMFTDFEPYDANRWAPFFDQPDLKASLLLKVNAPGSWTVIGNSKVAQQTNNGLMKQWTFDPTPIMSTYIYAMMAGPYYKYSSQYKNIPLGLYARKSFASNVKPEDWFKVTVQGLKYYEDFFGMDYPFQKYDQIIVPEFNSGAMENIGAVTFSERLIRRGQYTRSDLARINNIVLHEMAHMWFGDLVTMKWWDDLWLNESFATFMASKAMDEATEYKESWVRNRNEKDDAYWQDDLMSTHPIAGTVANSEEAFTNFDSITYDKGSAVLKSLHEYVGTETFRKAMAHYFKVHAYKNTTLKDFIASFDAVMTSSLAPWFKAWLQTSGADVLQSSIQCEAGRFQSAEFKSRGSSVRPHALQVALFSVKKEKPVMLGTFRVNGLSNENPMTYKESSSMACPTFIYPNYGDHAYIKVRFSPADLEFIGKHLAKISDPLLRVSIWNDLWQMVRDTELDPKWYADLILRSIPNEEDEAILNLFSRRATGDEDSLYRIWPKATEEEKKSFFKFVNNLEKIYFIKYSKAKAGSSLKTLLLGHYFRSIETQNGANNVAKILKTISDADVRWEGVQILCQENLSGIDSILANELKRDPSSTGQKQALACRARLPDLNIKTEFMAQLTAPQTPLSVDQTNRVIRNLFKGDQAELIAKFEGDILSALKGVWLTREATYQKTLGSEMAPVYCDASANKRFESFLNKEKSLPESFKTPLTEVWDDDRRCVNMKSKMKL